MEPLYSNKYIKIENNNSSDQLKADKSFNKSLQRDNLNTATEFTSFNNSAQHKNNLSNFDKYKNQQLLNQTILRNCKCNCSCHFNLSNSSRCNHCHPHHFHVHHIHIPRRNVNDIFNLENISNLKTANTSFTNSNNLLKEVTELRNECRKFKEELERNLNEKNAGNDYIRNLENEIYKNNNENNPDNNNRNNNEKERNNNFNRYHDMLNKSFEVLRSVSNKSKDKNCKTKGEVYYYMNKNDDFEQLIQAQKNWIDNLQDDNILPRNLPNNNFPINKTYSINDQNQDDPNNNNNFNNNNICGLNNNYLNNSNNSNHRNNNKFNNDNNSSNANNYDNINQNNFNVLNRDINKYNQDNNNNLESNNNNNNYQNNQMKGNNTRANPTRHYFDSKRNNNKGYIINRGDKINNNNNNYNEDNNEERQPLSNNKIGNYNTFPENINNNYEEEDNNNEEEEINTDNNINNNINNNLNNIINNNNNKTTPYLNNQNKNNEHSLNNNENDNENDNNDNYDNNINNKEEENESNPLDERYIILDENGNPIVVNGNKLLAMELIPLIGEDGKEVIDENGNIVLIGPDGQPKSQDELEPIILDNDKPLVNEENKPYLGLCGVPLINGEGDPIVGPDELYDNDNKVVEGIYGIVAKDNMGNPIKVNINDNDNNNKDNNNNNNNNNNNDELDENDNNDIEEEDINDNNIKSKSNKSNNNDNNGNNNIEERANQNNNNNNNGELNNKKGLRPLIGPDGIPLRDLNNEHIFLDENNIPVKNPGISVLTDKSGKPILNSLGMPVLIDREGRPVNTNGDPRPKKVYNYKKDEKEYGIGENPPDKEIKKDSFKVDYMNGNNNNMNDLKNKKRMYKNDNGRREMNYSECNPESLKKINFMRPYSNPFYDDNEYKVNCFACNLGCGVSKSGYSPMTFSPYNNLIRRRSITPLKGNIKLKKSKNTNNPNIRKINMGNDNNYYLTGN